jgi:D-threo-aldose 1-dehydrogenase
MATAILERRPLGATGLAVTPLCAGLAELGDMIVAVGYAVPEERARRTVIAALSGPMNFLDTAAAYGDGRSEARIGRVLRELGGLPDGVVLATKADMDQQTHDFSGDQARRSVERSLRLLGLDRLQLVYLHDPEACNQGFAELAGRGGAVETLVALQREGIIGALGYAGTELELADRFLGMGAFSVVITHSRFTLMDRTAGPWIERWAASVAVVNAAPYAGGMLARGAIHGRYQYRAPTAGELDRLAAIERACADFGVPVPAAALQQSLRHPGVTSTIVGMSRPERVESTLRLAATPIPDELWHALEPLAYRGSGEA